MTLKDFLADLVQEPRNDYITRPNQTSVHEAAPDIWFEILPFLDQRSKILEQSAEIPPELLQD